MTNYIDKIISLMLASIFLWQTSSPIRCLTCPTQRTHYGGTDLTPHSLRPRAAGERKQEKTPISYKIQAGGGFESDKRAFLAVKSRLSPILNPEFFEALADINGIKKPIVLFVVAAVRGGLAPSILGKRKAMLSLARSTKKVELQHSQFPAEHFLLHLRSRDLDETQCAEIWEIRVKTIARHGLPALIRNWAAQNGFADDIDVEVGEDESGENYIAVMVGGTLIATLKYALAVDTANKAELTIKQPKMPFAQYRRKGLMTLLQSYLFYLSNADRVVYPHAGTAEEICIESLARKGIVTGITKGLDAGTGLTLRGVVIKEGVKQMLAARQSAAAQQVTAVEPPNPAADIASRDILRPRPYEEAGRSKPVAKVERSVASDAGREATAPAQAPAEVTADIDKASRWIEENAGEILDHFTGPLSGTGGGIPQRGTIELNKSSGQYYETLCTIVISADAVTLYKGPRQTEKAKIRSFPVFTPSGQEPSLRHLMVSYHGDALNLGSFLAAVVKDFRNELGAVSLNLFGPVRLKKLADETNYAVRYSEPVYSLFKWGKGNTFVWKNNEPYIKIDISKAGCSVDWVTDSMESEDAVKDRVMSAERFGERHGLYIHGHPPINSDEPWHDRLLMSTADIISAAISFRPDSGINYITYGIVSFIDANTVAVRFYRGGRDAPLTYENERIFSYMDETCWFQDVRIMREGDKVIVIKDGPVQKYDSKTCSDGIRNSGQLGDLIAGQI